MAEEPIYIISTRDRILLPTYMWRSSCSTRLSVKRDKSRVFLVIVVRLNIKHRRKNGMKDRLYKRDWTRPPSLFLSGAAETLRVHHTGNGTMPNAERNFRTIPPRSLLLLLLSTSQVGRRSLSLSIWFHQKCDRKWETSCVYISSVTGSNNPKRSSLTVTENWG
jgi:hypothetical protein